MPKHSLHFDYRPGETRLPRLREPADLPGEGGGREADRHGKGATLAQVALAWLLAQKPWIVPIPGTTKLHRLKKSLGAANVELTAADLAEIRTAASDIQVEGERYPAHLLATTGR